MEGRAHNPPHCLLLSNKLLSFEKFSMLLNIISRCLPFGLWNLSDVSETFTFPLLYSCCIMELLPNESPQKHSQKCSEEDAGDFLPPDALISRAILKLSTTRSVEQLETHPRQWKSHQHCCWGNRSKKQRVEIKSRKERHFREDGATYLPGISFLCASLPDSYFSQESVIGIQYWKRTGRLFYKQLWTGHAGRCWGRSRNKSQGLASFEELVSEKDTF